MVTSLATGTCGNAPGGAWGLQSPESSVGPQEDQAGVSWYLGERWGGCWLEPWNPSTCLVPWNALRPCSLDDATYPANAVSQAPGALLEALLGS